MDNKALLNKGVDWRSYREGWERVVEGFTAVMAWPLLPWAIIGLGVLLRLFLYASNPSLDFDEAGITLNILRRSLDGLTQPLDYVQNAPLGFLLTEKLAVGVLGNNEYVLRLFPLLCSVASLFLFYQVAKRFLSSRAIPLALGLFAISDLLLAYSVQVKQYSGDVAIALVLLLLAAHLVLSRGGYTWLVVYGVFGAVAVWFSHPSAFVLAGTGSTLALVYFFQKDWIKLSVLAGAYVAWLISFGFTLDATVTHALENEGLVSRMSPLFLPFPPGSLDELTWYPKTFFKAFDRPGGIFFAGLAAFAFTAGCVSYFSRDKLKLALLLSPLVFTLAASAMGKYPLPGPGGDGARLTLFVVPFLLLLIGQGVDHLLRESFVHSRAIAFTFVVFLIFPPITTALETLSSPSASEDMRPVMEYVREHWEPGDFILVFRDQPGFEYYAERYGFTEDQYFIGPLPRQKPVADQLHAQYAGSDSTLWVVYAHVTDPDFYDDQRLLREYLDKLAYKIGTRKEARIELDTYSWVPQ